MDRVRNEEALIESWNIKGVNEQSGSESAEIVWACEKYG